MMIMYFFEFCRKCDSALLKQSVEFLKDVKEKKMLSSSVIDDAVLKANVDSLLKVISQFMLMRINDLLIIHFTEH